MFEKSIKRYVRKIYKNQKRVQNLELDLFQSQNKGTCKDKRWKDVFNVHHYFPIFAHNGEMDGLPFDADIDLGQMFTFSAAEKFPMQLLQILDKTSEEVVKISSARCDQYEETEKSKKLGNLFDRYGSDKNSVHLYTPYYVNLLTRICEKREGGQISILEIGLGSNNVDVPSNMGENGSPGASLHAFRDFCPEERVFGADIDRKILFNEERITTSWVDQLDPESLRQLPKQFIINEFDLIIDDGLHLTEANINTLLFAMEVVRIGGFIVIEDIPKRTMPV